ncbi:hypothetical protein SMC26_18350 [Actinomadura fulvescens]|uniref:DUF5648 domain-containing protein n=1 Tax=Actinomadura fulvescens TaxID=46160 RepID=A0ABN3QFP4_9ACTN
MTNRAGALGAVAAFTVAGITLTGCGTAKPQAAEKVSAGRADAAAVAAATSGRAKIYEFVTRSKQGYFYTTNRKEAERAKNKYKFIPTNRNLGYVSTKRFKGALTMYRLRYKARSAYLVTLSAKERDQLVRSKRFVYEGVLGYTAKTKGAGKFRLWRVSKTSWRAVNTVQAKALMKQGWKLNGPLGYVWVRP